MFCVAKINPFAELTVEDMSELIEKYDCPVDAKTLSAIKESAFKKAGLVTSKKRISLSRTAVTAACACLVLLAAAVTLTLLQNKPSVTPSPASDSSTAPASSINPLITAISKGDDRLIRSLLESSVPVSEDVLSYAMKYRNLLSFRSIVDIAKAVKENFGTTGLDPLVENAVFGNSDAVISLLNQKESVGSLNDRIAYFFSAAFCSSDVLRLFNEKGMDIQTTDENGDTVYDIAKQYGNTENQNYALSVDTDK